MRLKIVAMMPEGEIERNVDVPLRADLLDQYDQEVIEAKIRVVMGWAPWIEILDIETVEDDDQNEGDDHDSISCAASKKETSGRDLRDSRDMAPRAVHSREVPRTNEAIYTMARK